MTVPSPHLHDLLGVRWSGDGATFVDDDEVVAMQPVVPHVSETLPSVIHLDRLRAALERQQLRIVWAAVGERQFTDGTSTGWLKSEFSGVYSLFGNGIQGRLTQHKVIGPAEPGSDIGRSPDSDEVASEGFL